MNAKAIIHVGIALILLGIVAFTYRGGGGTSRERTADIGLVQAGVDIIQTMPIPPILGGIVLVSGIVLVAVGMKKSV